MERGIYFDAWYRDEHCFHPSLPMRRTQMIEDLKDYEATILVWSALGGGSLSLPYLEEEAFGQVPSRLRVYGYMNDSEFIRECGKHGIKVFGVVFEVQGWEFPAEISEDETRLLGLNILRGEGKKVWYGLREFSQDKYPKLFNKTFRDYFPEGLYNSEGEPVTDLWEECAARKWDGTPVHAAWVEVVGHEQICYQMCRNNPVWRAYLKKIIEIQIDAGVHGIHLDECELPITAINYGGCFCKDCMKPFNVYLKERQRAGLLPDAFKETNFDRFHYGDYLKANGIDFPGHNRGETPLFNEYFQFQMKIMTAHFKELTNHIREYGRSKGREVPISGNFFHVMHQYMPLQPEVDIIATEMRNTLYRQAYWYRYANGFAAGKPMTVVENPYGGIVPELLENLKAGRMVEQFQLMLLEAATFGCNLSIPYGGWMGNTIRDAFYAPKEPTMAVQKFLKKHDDLISDVSGAEIAVNYSYPSYWNRENDAVGDDDGQATMLSSTVNKDVAMPFWDIIKQMSKQHVPFDVVISDDGELFRDEFTKERLSRYKCLVLPDNNIMTPKQLETVLGYLDAGGNVVVYGRLADDRADARELADRVLTHPGTRRSDSAERLYGFVSAIRDVLPDAKFQIEVEGRPDIGINPHALANGDIAVHLVNYQFDRAQDRVVPVEAGFRLRTERSIESLDVHTLSGEAIKVQWRYEDGFLNVRIPSMPLYALVACKLA